MYESLTSEYTVGILLQCVFYIVVKTQYQLHVYVHMYCSIDACGQLQGTVPAAMMYCTSCSCTSYRYFTSFDKAPTGTCTYVPVHMYM